MPDVSPLGNERAQELLDSFRHQTGGMEITDSAWRLAEMYFFSNYGKFALRGEEDRILSHWEHSLPLFIEELKASGPYPNQRIGPTEMRAAIENTAKRSQQRGMAYEKTVNTDEKIPPPDW